MALADAEGIGPSGRSYIPVHVVVCPVHGERWRFEWTGFSYVLEQPCSAILPEESKAAGRLVRCEEKLTVEVPPH